MRMRDAGHMTADIAVHASRIAQRVSWIAAIVLALAAAGCGGVYPRTQEANYLTYQHPFSDAAAEAVRRSAEAICAQRKQRAVRTGGTCSLTECTTHYQCVSE